VVEAISGPAAELGVSYSEEAMALLVERSRRYPYFVQLYAEETWWAAAPPPGATGFEIGVEAVERGIGPAERRLDEGLYRIRFEKASPAEQAYLFAMAALEPQRISSGEVARRLGRSHQQASSLRDRLMAKGIVYAPAHGFLEFSVPGFGDYLRRLG
jgi:hypothetical protein